MGISAVRSLPTTNHQPPTTNHQPPTTNHQPLPHSSGPSPSRMGDPTYPHASVYLGCTQGGKHRMDNANNTNVLSALSSGMADAVERIGPALVLVNGRQRLPGSGVVYAEDTVVTADHVIEREEDLSVETQDGRKLPAQFAGRDP